MRVSRIKRPKFSKYLLEKKGGGLRSMKEFHTSFIYYQMFFKHGKTYAIPTTPNKSFL